MDEAALYETVMTVIKGLSIFSICVYNHIDITFF